METKVIQICGTGSGVGKSVVVSGLCRIFLQDGFKVAPFKAQNMSLNSFVTYEGGEIGRAQAVQAAACGLKPSVDMNPVLLKPTSDIGSQVILRGRPAGNMSAMRYKEYKNRAKACVMESFNRLRKNFEVIVIEGAGSPAEVNLKSHDIVNMKMAQAAGAPVILVGDIDKGGVFAWLIGTLELLAQKERNMVKGFIINKFRGDKRLLKPGIDFLQKKTAIKVLGVIPYFYAYGEHGIKIPEEDSVILEQRANDPLSRVPREQRADTINIAVVRLPHISNFTDFDALEYEPDVRLSYIDNKEQLNGQDVIIIPGTKNTIEDLLWLKRCGLADKIPSTLYSSLYSSLIGICGGYQMLGHRIRDAHRIESAGKEAQGLGLLPIVTNFDKEKLLAQVKAKSLTSNLEVSGYEIHHGRTENLKNSNAVFNIIQRQGKKVDDLDGTASCDGRIWGTYIHGLFDEAGFRRDFLNRIRAKKGLDSISCLFSLDLDGELDKLAGLLRAHIDMGILRKILFGKV